METLPPPAVIVDKSMWDEPPEGYKKIAIFQPGGVCAVYHPLGGQCPFLVNIHTELRGAALLDALRASGWELRLR